MSNYLAIATVTATVQSLIQTAIQQDMSGATVTTVRPDSGGAVPDKGVNIYMYQVSPNPAWRNADLRNRRPKGDLGKQAQAGLDLYYLMTFYGNDIEYEPQRLLGITVRTLIDQPILTQEMIQQTVLTHECLRGSTLADQIEKVTLTPATMNTEELSKIWSVFFQTPYVLSFAYQGSTVLIEGDKPGKASLPIRTRSFYVTANQPFLEEITSDAGLNQPIVLDNIVTIRGKQFGNFNVRVKIGEATVTPQEVSDTLVKLNLAALRTQEASSLKAGVQTLQILHSNPNISGSNILPFVLSPKIIEVRISDTQKDNDLCSGEVVVELDLIVDTEQKVFLLLNQQNVPHPENYVFNTNRQTEATSSLVFSVKDIEPGEYLVRVQIDGAESPLKWEENSQSSRYEQYIEPALTIL